jgi:hypothetical protein
MYLIAKRFNPVNKKYSIAKRKIVELIVSIFLFAILYFLF